MKTITKTIAALWMSIVLLTLVSCSKENDKKPEGTNECWYSVTIDGQATGPNMFGQDKISITSAKDIETGEEFLGFTIGQQKGNDLTSLIVLAHGLLNSKSTTGVYPANSFVSRAFNTPSAEQWPMYAVGDLSDDEYIEERLTFNLVENSDQRIRMNVSGMALKLEELAGEVVETATVPVKVELTVGRKYYVEHMLSGEEVGGAACACQD